MTVVVLPPPLLMVLATLPVGVCVSVEVDKGPPPPPIPPPPPPIPPPAETAPPPQQLAPPEPVAAPAVAGAAAAVVEVVDVAEVPLAPVEAAIAAAATTGGWYIVSENSVSSSLRISVRAASWRAHRGGPFAHPTPGSQISSHESVTSSGPSGPRPPLRPPAEPRAEYTVKSGQNNKSCQRQTT